VASRFVYWCTLGSGRRTSEDRVEVFERGDELAVVVADGAGGMCGGAVASAALVEAVRNVGDVLDADMWARLLRQVDSKLATHGTGETTAVVVVIGPDGLTGVSVGDSEAWAVTATSIDDLTRGQERSRLGSGRAVPVVFQRPSLEGALLVATDGLFKYASGARIAATIRESSVEQTADRLVSLVKLPSGGFPDDVAVAVVAPLWRLGRAPASGHGPMSSGGGSGKLSVCPSPSGDETHGTKLRLLSSRSSSSSALSGPPRKRK
jgi:serine/threonine protein phosphatase PrpC